MKKLICITLFCVAALSARCQFIDSLQSDIEKRGSFSFCFNTRNSYIGNNSANIFGFNVGVCFGKKLTIGGGLNTLSNTIYEKKIEGTDTIKGKLNFTYITYFIQYTINLSKHWRIEIPVSIGIGSSNYQYTDNKVLVTASNKTIMPIEPQIELDYNFNKYCGLYTQVGYRYMLLNNRLLDYDFNSVTYSVGVLIYPLEIFAGIFPRTKLARAIEE